MKKLILFLAVITLSFNAIAEHITVEHARKNAEHFLLNRNNKAKQISAVETSITRSSIADEPFYIFNVGNNEGFVIVSGDDRTEIILGYSDHGFINPNSIPSNMASLFEWYKESISTLGDNSQIKTKAKENRSAIAPLVKTQWGQEDPYNSLCPVVDGQRSVTGCVATALAQIVNYHKWPQGNTQPIPGYTTSSNQLNMPELAATYFDWENMNNANISKLMLYCGQLANMDYGINESGAYTDTGINNLIKYFGYSKGVKFIWRTSFSNEEWDQIMYDELLGKRPILYSSTNEDWSTSHAYIVDGYEDGYYHINWGWDGKCDGYFTIKNLQPSEERTDFSYRQCMYINLSPKASKEDGCSKYLVLKILSKDVRDYIERPQNQENYPAFTVGAGYVCDLEETTERLSFALYKDGNFVNLIHTEKSNSLTEGMNFINSTVILPTNLTKGEYQIKVVCENNDSGEWEVIKNGDIEYIYLLIEEDGFFLEYRPKENVNDDYKDFGIQTIDGVTYHLYYENKGYQAEFRRYNNRFAYKGDLYLPEYIEYEGKKFLLGRYLEIISDMPELTSFSTSAERFDGIRNCDNLKRLDLREGVSYFDGMYSCNSIENIEFPSSLRWCSQVCTNCKNLKYLVFNNEPRLTIKLYENDWIGNTSLTDIYFKGQVPPILSITKNPYKNITIHVPSGTLDIYKNSDWSEWNIVDDISDGEKVQWDYCGSDEQIIGGGCGIGCNVRDTTNIIELAMRMPVEMIEAYKGNQITSIEFYTLPYFTNDDHREEAEYVFIATPSKEHAVKKAVKTIRGAWTKIDLDEPYTISGDEDIFVGIGRKDILRMWYANMNEVQDYNWIRVLGENHPGQSQYEPNKWHKHQKHPYPIRAIIKGDKLPMDALITDFEIVDNESEDRLQVRVRTRNRVPHIIKEITFDWEIDGLHKGSQTFQTLMLNNAEKDFYIDIPTDISGKDHTIKINVSSIDGLPDEIKANSSIELKYTALSAKYFPRKIVMEQSTGIWNGMAPLGLVTIEKMKKEYPDNFIAISVHNDELSPAEYGYSQFFETVKDCPIALINRKKTTDAYPFSLDNLMNKGTAKIELMGTELNEDKELRITTNVVFGFDNTENADYRIGIVLTEDSVGPYMQANSFSSPSSEDNPDNDMNWWIHQEEVVETYYNNVARAIFEDCNGTKGLLPSKIKFEEIYSNQISIKLPDNIINVENVKVIALLIDGTTGEILNADEKVLFEKGSQKEVLVGNIMLDHSTYSLAKDETLQLIATVLPENATNKDVSWTTSDDKVVTVSETGLVTFVGFGDAVVTATAADGSGVFAVCTFSNVDGMLSISLDENYGMEIYTVNGQRIEKVEKGIYIIKPKSGKSKKVVIK